MAEMTTLVAAVYRKYTTTTVGIFDTVSPGITSRYEVFYDERCSGVKVSFGFHYHSTKTKALPSDNISQEHECRIKFDISAA